MSNRKGYLPKGMHPLKPKGDPYSDAVRAKLKGSSSQKRKDAARLRRLKEKLKENPDDINDDTWRWVTDSKYFSSQIVIYIKKLLKEVKDKKLKVALLGKLIEAKKAILPPEQRNINLGYNTIKVEFVNKEKKEKVVEIDEKGKVREVEEDE